MQGCREQPRELGPWSQAGLDAKRSSTVHPRQVLCVLQAPFPHTRMRIAGPAPRVLGLTETRAPKALSCAPGLQETVRRMAPALGLGHPSSQGHGPSAPHREARPIKVGLCVLL